MMEYTSNLHDYDAANILSRVSEADENSPIEMFYHGETNGFFVVFGRCVESEKWKKSFHMDYLGTFTRDSTKASVVKVLRYINNKLQ